MFMFRVCLGGWRVYLGNSGGNFASMCLLSFVECFIVSVYEMFSEGLTIT